MKNHEKSIIKSKKHGKSGEVTSAVREKTDIAKMKDQSSLRAFNAYVFKERDRLLARAKDCGL